MAPILEEINDEKSLVRRADENIDFSPLMPQRAVNILVFSSNYFCLI